MKIIIGLSGGVDSSVAALLLKQQGHDVEAVFMKNWENEEDLFDCPATVDMNDALAVCETIGIKLRTINFSKEYWDRVFEYFLTEYKAYRTPNPDVLCNKEIKFKAFLDYAKELGGNFMATGHYVRKRLVNGKYQLLCGIDNNKDQSYFLYALNQQQIAYSLFPIGDLEKPQVRQIAIDNKLPTCAKKDSTGICFIGERKFKQFLSRYLPAQPGDIVTPEGKIIGRHEGLMYHTLGQRKGLGIGGLKGEAEAPWYVAKKDVKNNKLIVVQDHDDPLLLQDTACATQLTWISNEAPPTPFSCQAKTRYRQAMQDCVIESIKDDIMHVRFAKAQRAVTPGQSLVIYDGEVCLGGGVINY